MIFGQAPRELDQRANPPAVGRGIFEANLPGLKLPGRRAHGSLPRLLPPIHTDDDGFGGRPVLLRPPHKPSADRGQDRHIRGGPFVVKSSIIMPAILAVDSSSAVTGLLKAILEPGGFEVTVSDNAEEAIEEYRDGDFDLVLSAIAVEPVDGIMLLENLLQIDSDAIVILMASNATKEMVIEAFDRGAFGFQERPFKIKELIEDINRGVDHRRKKDSGLTQEGVAKRLRRRFEKEIAEKTKVVEEIVKEAEEIRERADTARALVEASEQMLEEREAFLELSEKTMVARRFTSPHKPVM